MTKRAIRRERVGQDLEAIARHYRKEGGAELALRFVAAFEEALIGICERPGAGSPRYGHMLGVSALRHWRFKRFPYLLFYIDQVDHIDIWSIIHASRDIPNSLQDSGH